MEFYERLKQAKKTLKLTNEDLGIVVDKKADAFRLAIVKKSLKKHDIAELEIYLDRLEDKQPEEKENPQPKEEGFLKSHYEKIINTYIDLVDLINKDRERMRKELDLERSKNNK